MIYEDGTEAYLDELPTIGNETTFSTCLPFSFVYDGKPSAEFLKSWKKTETTEQLDANRVRRTLVFTDPNTGLQVTCTATEFTDFPTCEWTLLFKNTGTGDTPIIENIQAADLAVSGPKGTDFLLHHSCGAKSTAMDYAPMEMDTRKGGQALLCPQRRTSRERSLALLQRRVGRPRRHPGRWVGRTMGIELLTRRRQPSAIPRRPAIDPFQATPRRASPDTPHYHAVLERGRLDRCAERLAALDESPQHAPPQGPPAPRPILCTYTGHTGPVIKELAYATEEGQLACLNRYVEEQIGQDYWWTDAGWYPCGGNWGNTGTWEVDKTRFPNGLKAISDAAHRNGMKTLLWFEPERVRPNTWLSDTHQDWLLGGVLLNLGNPDALHWLINQVDKVLTEEDIDLYRQDFNMDPLHYWRTNDTPDRQGMTENKHVQGYMRFWDELQRRRPGMLIDSCASGGRRNEPDAMRRAVPLWRSDHAYHVVANQCITYGASLWLPYYGTGVTASASRVYTPGPTPVEPYAFWSTATPSDQPHARHSKERESTMPRSAP